MPTAAIASAAKPVTLPTGRSHVIRPCSESVRTLDTDTWRESGVPLLRDPRRLVTRLYDLHRPEAGTAVVAVLDGDGRPVASASFAFGDASRAVDGWECRNLILASLRLIVPDDLRRSAPVRTTVLLLSREGTRDWHADDGRWMWGLRDACGLHGLRCGAVVVLGEDGWEVVGDGRSGRTPSSAPVVAPASVRKPRKKPGKSKRARKPADRPRERRPKSVDVPPVVELPTFGDLPEGPGLPELPAAAAAFGSLAADAPPPASRAPAIRLVRAIPAASA